MTANDQASPIIAAVDTGGGSREKYLGDNDRPPPEIEALKAPSGAEYR